MDIIQTQTEEFAEYAQLQIHLARVEMARAQGYTIINNPSTGIPEIVPKNLNGEDNLDAPRTSRWDVPRETPDDTYKVQDWPGVVIPDGVREHDYNRIPEPIEWLEGYPSDKFNSQFNPEQFEV